ncbi:MAG TPA: FtsK/SpoIIIE domain-containing protein [Thermoguttaceae bacterium]|nr:FtsK/SpoIIIE domain-containing protein [Thermoguttaceae bacterium]
MSENFSADRPEQLWKELQQLVADRAARESQIADDYAAEKERTESEYHAARTKAVEERERRHATLERDYINRRREIIDRCDAAHAALEGELNRIGTTAKNDYKAVKAQETQVLKESRWEANTVFEATKDAPKKRLKIFASQIAAGRQGLNDLSARADELVARRHQRVNPDESEPSDWPEDADPTERFNSLVKEVQSRWSDLVAQRVGHLFEGGQLYVLAVLSCAAAVVPAGFLFGWTQWPIWVPAGFGVGLGLWGALYVWLYRIARRETSAAHAALRQTLLDAQQAAERALDAARRRCKQEEAAIAQRLRSDLEKADKRFATTVETSRAQRDSTIQKAEEHFPPRMRELIVARERDLEQIETEHARRMEEFERRHREETEKRERDHAAAVAQRERRHQDTWDEMSQRWHDGMTRFQQEVTELNRTKHELFFDWHGRDAAEWKPPLGVPPAVPFGQVAVELGRLDGGIPFDPRLQIEPTQYTLPALAPFPARSILFSAADEGRAAALDAIRAVMLRMLTGIRPGKVRFTVIDPVGLGESFSAFMHLADFDEQAISSRIWTEASHIEQQLVKLTEHMETVIQVYLRNEFETIQQYNEYAGEMAEPYRVLVVANFPANFTEAAARRLLSIATSGARCGVYVLLSVDTKAKPPHGFLVSDLEAEMLQLVWKDGRFRWKGSPLASLPLELDTPPDAKPFTDLVRAVGAQIHEIDRVEVPFEFVVPTQEQWWQGDTAREIVVPLGRAGAMKLQHLNLGRGTSQHVLIAGKTGSGKSNLLHTIITNVALWYSPDQVEMYLVDFKKGVEFKAYAESRLPHARVVAIESEREFGLSVLERLDAELKDRGDRFRKIGVQDMAGWRRERPDETMPRVLLVIDEFQELFVEDDRIAQNATLLLDRLVRQGRAFGMHVLLGSQTLAGAYSLPRATIGQMAVRIALQCSESDAHLILSEENTAARLLTRPGEAIYNDANGLFEGNHPFQIVFLPDHEKAEYLGRLRDWSASQGCRPAPPIVFEGNAAANPRDNWQLEQVLSGDNRPAAAEPPLAWLGSAVAIKDPTSITFRRQGGTNLLLVGHDEEAALGILTTSMVSLAAQTPASSPLTSEPNNEKSATFHVLDGTRPEAPEADFWRRFAGFLPSVQVADPRDMPTIMAKLSAECSRRHAENLDNAPPIYLVIYNLGRFRDLRREEDSFRFSSSSDDKPPSPAVQLNTLLREGPSVGIHVLMWCDTCNTLNRWMERQTIHDMEMRVVFQMSGGDSSLLIDSADASRLGAHRAILYDEGLGQTEKFRPYRVPDETWLAQVRAQLAKQNS